jgi:hypothetical protein
VAGSSDVLAFDSLGTIGTVGVFGPAALLVALVVYAVIRDRRLTAREEAAERSAGEARDSDVDGATPPRRPD